MADLADNLHILRFISTGCDPSIIAQACAISEASKKLNAMPVKAVTDPRSLRSARAADASCLVGRRDGVPALRGGRRRTLAMSSREVHLKGLLKNPSASANSLCAPSVSEGTRRTKSSGNSERCTANADCPSLFTTIDLQTRTQDHCPSCRLLISVLAKFGMGLEQRRHGIRLCAIKEQGC